LELEFEEPLDELLEEPLDELFDEPFELEFDELLDELLDELFEELLDELFEASCSFSTAGATMAVSGAATRAWALSMPTPTSAAPARVVAVIIFFMSLSCCGRPSRRWPS
jgi:hypothetical protein